MLITLRPDASTVPCTDGLKRIEEHVALGQWQRSSVIFVIQEERFDEVVLVADEVSDVIGTHGLAHARGNLERVAQLDGAQQFGEPRWRRGC